MKKKNLVKIGIVQGRLTNSKKLQNLPKNPIKEFNVAKELGYNFIEIFAERKKNKKNPIWNNGLLEDYINYARDNNLIFESACDDYIIKNGFNTRYLKYVNLLLKNLSKLKIKKFILPLEGKAEINQHNIKKIIFYLNKISIICKKNKIPNLLIEANIDSEIFFLIKKNIINKNIFFLYDLGNRVNKFKNVQEDIASFKNHIRQFHIKDKNSKDINVPIGTGNVNFKKAFTEIRKNLNKNISFVFENNRENDAYKTAQKNIMFLKKLIS